MMTKDEIKALIAETMRSNNKKEITAQAIADIFYEVVDAMGEGSGGGYEKIYFMTSNFFGDELNYDTVDLILQMFEEEFGFDCSDIRNMAKEQFAHNARMYAKIVEEAKTHTNTLFVTDCSLFEALGNLLFSVLEGSETNLTLYATLPLAVVATTSETRDATDVLLFAMDEDGEIVINSLHEDGGVTIRTIESTPTYIYYPEENKTISEEQKEHNKNVLYDSSSHEQISCVIRSVYDGRFIGNERVLNSLAEYADIDGEHVYAYALFTFLEWRTNKLKQVTVEVATGDATVTTLGTLTLS